MIKIDKNFVIAKSEISFVLGKQKGVNFPLSIYDEKNQLKKYLGFLRNQNKLSMTL